MDDIDAAAIADKTLTTILEHQPQVISAHSFANPGNAKLIAQNLAVFRQELIQELKKHER